MQFYFHEEFLVVNFSCFDMHLCVCLGMCTYVLYICVYIGVCLLSGCDILCVSTCVRATVCMNTHTYTCKTLAIR